MFANRFLEGYPYLCRATDISQKGMRVYRFSEPDVVGSGFSRLQFQLPGDPQVISASGEIAFHDRDSGALGIRFTHLSKTAAVAIERYLGEVRTER